LDATEVDALSNEISLLVVDYPQCFRSGFIRETPEKLRRIGLHFRAQLGEVAPEAPRCNAPWVSAVIESDGAVRPCFFHAPLGNIHSASLSDVLNGDAAVRFRTHLDISKNPTCQRCVCSLFLEAGSLSQVASAREEARRIARPVPA